MLDTFDIMRQFPGGCGPWCLAHNDSYAPRQICCCEELLSLETFSFPPSPSFFSLRGTLGWASSALKQRQALSLWLEWTPSYVVLAALEQGVSSFCKLFKTFLFGTGWTERLWVGFSKGCYMNIRNQWMNSYNSNYSPWGLYTKYLLIFIH